MDGDERVRKRRGESEKRGDENVKDVERNTEPTDNQKKGKKCKEV